MISYRFIKRVFAGFFLLCLLFAGIRLHAQEAPRRHIVQELENYYSISLKYDISIDVLKNANPDITTPKQGDVLIIPVLHVPGEPMADDCDRMKGPRKGVIRVALMIPLFLEEVGDSLWSEKLDPARISEINQFRFIQFYHGLMIAADSLQQQGFDLEIRVFDVDHQPVKVEKVLQDPALKNMDLIIGPFHKNSFTIAARFARENQIPIVNPFSSKADILPGNPWVYKVLPSPGSQPELVARLITRDFPDHRVMIYTANKLQGAATVNELKDKIEERRKNAGYPVEIIDYAADSIQGFYDFAMKDVPNLVIIYAENEALPAALLGKLNEHRADYDISVIGLPEWDKFSNLETPYLMALNVHILASSYLDTGRPRVKSFIQKYRALHNDEPLNYALSGFDVGYFFLYALGIYGRDFEKCLPHLNLPLLQNRFVFQKENEPDGYENEYWKVLKFEDYRLIDRSFN